jgi:hypothetical protein
MVFGVQRVWGMRTILVYGIVDCLKQCLLLIRFTPSPSSLVTCEIIFGCTRCLLLFCTQCHICHPSWLLRCDIEHLLASLLRVCACRNGKFDRQSAKEHKRSIVTHVNVALLKLQQVSFAMGVNNHTRALAFARWVWNHQEIDSMHVRVQDRYMSCVLVLG